MNWKQVGLCALVAVIAGGTGFVSGQQANTPEPMVYEMRTYYTVEGRLPNLHERFKNHTMKLFEKHGMKNVIYTVPTDKPNTLIYLLAHKSQAAAKASFEAFRKDPDWIAARDASEKDGKIVEKLESVFLTPTDYSPMK